MTGAGLGADTYEGLGGATGSGVGTRGSNGFGTEAIDGLASAASEIFAAGAGAGADSGIINGKGFCRDIETGAGARAGTDE